MDPEQLLLQHLRAADLSDDEIDRARRDGQLATRAVEVALGDGTQHTLTEVARAAGLRSTYVRELMQALGRPDPGHGDPALTDEDIELARIAREMLDAGLPAHELTEVTRVVGLAMSQSAEAVRRMVGVAFLEAGDTEEALGARYLEAVDKLAPLVPDLFSLSFRAHLRDGISGELLTEAERHSGRLADTAQVAVAFADLVGYTSIGDRVSAGELGSIAGRFAALGTSVSRRPVRLVKTIGDAIMFVSPDPKKLMEVMIDLRAAVHAAEPALPEVKIGLAFGPATPRGGDWFGTTVNLASRVAEAARPGQLLVTDDLAAQVSSERWRKRRRRAMRGLDGRVRLWSYEQER
jgi:adenylate cyclase